MVKLLLLMFTACLILLIVGLIKPGLVIRWGKRTRKSVILTYTLGMIISFGAFYFVNAGEAYDAKEQSAAIDQAEESESNEEDIEKDSIDGTKLLTIIGKDWNDVSAVIGEPLTVENGPSGEVLIYDTYTLKIDSNKVSEIRITSDEAAVSGVKVGMGIWKAAEKLGEPYKRTNDKGICVEYKENQALILLYADDALSPIHTINIIGNAFN